MSSLRCSEAAQVQSIAFDIGAGLADGRGAPIRENQ